MPKVTEEYLIDKRNFILKCTGEVLKKKPLYLITMRDIIKKSGFSQGAIYRYYSGLDGIYADFINTYTTNTSLEQRIDTVLSSGQAEKTILAECFMAMGEYIEELLKSVVGKTFFELTVLYAYDFEKRAAVFSNLKFKKSLEYAQGKIVEYAMINVEKGVFRPKIPPRSIIQFVSSFIDGIAQSVALNSSEMVISEMFQTLAKAVVNFLEV
ncbi:TetR/AcrR family transcriptional regulator [Leadbettera azotonutricia]|uniref:Transcriptional regulator, TetR family n=1 Tax=Leadbettera azotonutricia (strain ATCC BAA-888 / DSM 13862 / ZAS-9) TaxID=545695 RepID=F5YEG2_LEAAZ|nr:TetR/AcrR family transcriptional regulator [Leadbettera azotonutricia]AEF82113.1 transcriptional regulator, TetR family [Leadbettera azotonutricia ZAS-9]